MQLHVLGPAFGLPSIDAECIAAIALLRAQLKDDAWTVTPAHDISLGLPFLEDDSQQIHGFSNIATYIISRSKASPFLTATQRANSTALSAFLSHNAQTLLDISLYVSFDNYTTTRTAFTAILPWYANYTVPPRLRESARKRTAHLGISSIDVDDSDVHDSVIDRPPGFDTSMGKEKKGFEVETQKRASLLLSGGRNTVSGLLAQRGRGVGGGAVFKLHALAENFFDVMRDLLGKGEFFSGAKEPSAVDCLAYAYLSLMLYPALPQDWLSKVMRGKYKSLARFTEGMHERLGMGTDARAVMGLGRCKSEEEVAAMWAERGIALPWVAATPGGLKDITITIGRDMISRIPFIGSQTTIVRSTPSTTQLWQRYFPAIAFTLTATLGGFGYYAFATGLLIWPHGEEMHVFGRRRLADYGHLGAAIAGVSMLSRQAAQAGQWEEKIQEKPVLVEVDVEKDTVS